MGLVLPTTVLLSALAASPDDVERARATAIQIRTSLISGDWRWMSDLGDVACREIFDGLARWTVEAPTAQILVLRLKGFYGALMGSGTADPYDGQPFFEWILPMWGKGRLHRFPIYRGASREEVSRVDLGVLEGMEWTWPFGIVTIDLEDGSAVIFAPNEGDRSVTWIPDLLVTCEQVCRERALEFLAPDQVDRWTRVWVQRSRIADQDRAMLREMARDVLAFIDERSYLQAKHRTYAIRDLLQSLGLFDLDLCEEILFSLDDLARLEALLRGRISR